MDSPGAIAAALRADAPVRELFVSDAHRWRTLVSLARERGAAVIDVPERVIAALSDTSTPQGAVAVATVPDVRLDDIVGTASLVVLLADVRDPGNAGTLVRAAAAARADAVVFAVGSVDALHPKTVRAAAGALWQVPVARGLSVEDCIDALRSAGLVVVGADARAVATVDTADLTRRAAFVLGNEAWGLGRRRELVDELYSIPMPGPVESLNVGVAGSIFLFEAARQRRHAGD